MKAARLSRARASQAVAFALLWVAAAIVIAPVFGILCVMILKGARGLTWGLLGPGPESLLPAVVGTLYLVGLTAAIAAPVGVAAAVYLSEYARAGPLVRAIRLAIVTWRVCPRWCTGSSGWRCS